MRWLTAFSLATLMLVPYAGAEDRKPAPAAPVITHSPELDSFEELVWANRDKLNRWCLTCLGFHGWRETVEYFRKRLADPDVDTDIWKAREALLREVRDNQFEGYIARVEARTTDNLSYKKVSVREEPEGLRTLEFRVTERDETGAVTSVHYELHTVTYNRRLRVWDCVTRKQCERSELQKRSEEINTRARGK